MKQSCQNRVCTCAVMASVALCAAVWAARADGFGRSVMEFGAKGDGVTDDTAAIQAAINWAAERGGGKILFPYTKNGYRLGSPAKETLDGKPLRAQLYIPAGYNHNIQLEGEMPCRLLNTYRLRSPGELGGKSTVFEVMRSNNTRIFSDWHAPEERNPEARPWAMLAAPKGNSCAGKFSVSQFSIKNLEFRAPLDPAKMYPTTSAVNLQNVGRVNIQDCQFCLDRNVGDWERKLELQPNPCHTVGLMASGDQNDDQILRNVAVQGFRYGFVLGEHIVADCLYVHNCEEGIVFHDSTHLSMIQHVVAQHNTVILSTTRGKLFGHVPAQVNVEIGSVDYEAGPNTKPAVSVMKLGVLDPENRLRGRLRYRDVPWEPVFKKEGGKNFACLPFTK